MGVSFKTIDSKGFTQNNRNDKFKYKITLKKHVWHIKTKIAVSYNECNNNWMLLEKNGEFGMATKVEVEFIKSYYIDLKQTNKVNYTTSKYKTIYYYK